ncbi:hypothetical protein DHEL01_v208539 [Diaporthe helianthi]|uniref:Uncharacterized protein n=1 Tax=Diaporthe helianthi TaxID=158607 RepID=A0A2P5HS28_DIAHE|nr:hypothetical protein DHEL01_v208539 [Diaporthe helianthi]
MQSEMRFSMDARGAMGDKPAQVVQMVVGTNDRLVDPGQRPIHAASGFVPFQSFCSAPATKGLEGALEVQERNDRIGDKILQEGFRRQKGTCRNPRYWLYGGVHSVKFIGVVWFMLCLLSARSDLSMEERRTPPRRAAEEKKKLGTVGIVKPHHAAAPAALSAAYHPLQPRMLMHNRTCRASRRPSHGQARPLPTRATCTALHCIVHMQLRRSTRATHSPQHSTSQLFDVSLPPAAESPSPQRVLSLLTHLFKLTPAFSPPCVGSWTAMLSRP